MNRWTAQNFSVTLLFTFKTGNGGWTDGPPQPLTNQPRGNDNRDNG